MWMQLLKLRKSYKRKGCGCSFLATSTPLNLNPRYGTKERKIGCKNTTLMIVEKRGESKVFEGVLMCLGEKLERENLPRNCPKTHFCKMRGLGSFIVKKMTLWLLAHLVGPPFAGYPTDISSFGLFSVQLWTHI